MMRSLGGILGLFLVVLGVTLPVILALRQQQHMKNFHVVREGVLYRSGQMTLPGLQRAIREHGIRTVVSLREGVAAQDLAEERYCTQQEIRFVRLLPRGWDDSSGSAPIDGNLRAFLDVMRDPANHPVLVHCYAGIHRTGAYCAVYRMEFERWDNAQAIAELKALGYDNFDREMDIRGYLEHYTRGRFAPSLPPTADLLSDLTPEDLRRLAVAADRAGKCEEAIEWYERIAETFTATHAEFVRKARERAEYLRDDLAAQRGEIPQPLHAPQLP